MRENRPSSSEGGAGLKPLFLPLWEKADSETYRALFQITLIRADIRFAQKAFVFV
jgi:hypothetical protein